MKEVAVMLFYKLRADPMQFEAEFSMERQAAGSHTQTEADC